MRRLLPCGALLLLAATPAAAQVQVDLRLEKTRYLAGEPVVVVVDVRNVGDEPVGYGSGAGEVRLAVKGAQRRQPPNIFGCFSGMSIDGGRGWGDHPPMLPPGQTTSFRYLLKEYELRPGQYELTASGQADVQWKSYSSYAVQLPNVPLPPPSRHKESDPVSGAQFDRTLSLNIVASTERELKAAFAPLVADADARDPAHRQHARAAIIESAPPFLESSIARFAADSYVHSAIDALGRIATASSRSRLKALYSRADSPRSTIVLALARIGHRADSSFFETVLRDASADQASREFAALGLGRIGGTRSVRSLERALNAVPPETRPRIATALGNTRSRAAVPVLIRMFGNNSAQNDVCGALTTLTHGVWCDGSAGDPAGTRRRWLRRWNQEASNARLFGPDSCPADPAAPELGPVAPETVTRAVELTPLSDPPTIASLRPAVTAPNTVVAVTGYAPGLEDRDPMRFVFAQGGVERRATIGSSSARDDGGGIQYLIDVHVPADLTPGQWQVVVEANGRRSVPVAVEITEAPQTELTGITPTRPHPAQFVLLTATPAAQIGDHVQLTDARGTQWQIETGVSSSHIALVLPDDVADGEASVRVGRSQNGVDRFSRPLTFLVTSDPLPLSASAVAWMTPVAPGQWTDLGKDADIEFEARRADRVEVEFRQGNRALIRRAAGPDNLRVQIPRRLAPGAVSVRTRTWIEKRASEWSAPAPYRVLERPTP